MAKMKRQQIYVIFVLVMLFGAWFVASAISMVSDVGQKKQQLVYDKPLSNAEEAVFLQQNKVVAKYFFSQDCVACADTDQLLNTIFQDFAGGLVIEMIDVDQYRDVADSLDVTDVPELHLKGSTIDVIKGNMTYDDVYNRICNLFFNPVEQCDLV